MNVYIFESFTILANWIPQLLFDAQCWIQYSFVKSIIKMLLNNILFKFLA